MPKGGPFIEATPVNFDELARKYKGAREYVLKAMHQSLREGGQLLTPQVKAETPVGATSKLRNYTVFQIMGKAEDMRCEIRQSAFSDKGFPYGVAVRTGTKPHFPPIDALVPWVIKKLGVEVERARQVAFLVCRKISRVGTKANPYHVRVYNRNKRELVEIMKRTFAEFMAKLNDIPRAA